MTDTPDNTLPVAPSVPVPPDHAPDLMPYAQWRQDEDKGARRAHDDARVPEPDRTPPADVYAEGYAFWDGYQRHMSDLRDAGVIR